MNRIMNLQRVSRTRRWADNATRHVVSFGGIAVVGAIALIFLYLLWVVAPIFAPARIATGTEFSLQTGNDPVAYADLNESGEMLLAATRAGSLRFYDYPSGRLNAHYAMPTGIRSMQSIAGTTGEYVLLDADNALWFVRAAYPIDFDSGSRRMRAVLEFPYTRASLALGELDAFDVARPDDKVVVAWLNGNELNVREYRSADEGFPLGLPRAIRIDLAQAYSHVFFGPRAQWLYLVADSGAIEVLGIASLGSITRIFTGTVVSEGRVLRAVTPLLGRYSLVVADDTNQITQWFIKRGRFGQQLQAVRSFETAAPAVRLFAEPRRKGFASLTADGTLSLHYATSHRTLDSVQTSIGRNDALAISPRSDHLIAAARDGTVRMFELHNEHPDISWSALWSKVWYEGYEEPLYSWQSSSADNDFEPKFSLTPLAFGTLKAAFYALLFAVPIAVMGAIYTAYFMAPSMRRIVKPGIEIMAALPTVILGFLGGLWLAPIIESNLSSVITILVALPFALLILAWFWSLLPDSVAKRFDGWFGLLVIPVILATVYIAFALGPTLEDLFFGGDSRAWFLEVMGLSYDQRNALVVGLIMGLAVIPTIFSIAEDAIYGVPTHLINGSLALGATPWQTLVRVVLLTASPGIFSAVMIGMGRAVGETMIVLMATGNTPVMNFNIFEGMRTFAANIAVELPESEVASSHYRILFLAALVLFAITFVFNTAAEIVRQRLRERYGSL